MWLEGRHLRTNQPTAKLAARRHGPFRVAVTIPPSPARDSPRDVPPTATLPDGESVCTPEDKDWDWQAEEDERTEDRLNAVRNVLSGRLVSESYVYPDDDRYQEPWE